MLPVTQTILHSDPSGRLGNCLQAAVASLLELPIEDVPHFVQHDDWLERLAAFCLEHGYQAVICDPDAYVAYGMAWGRSPRGVRHAVVWADGGMAWDPHPSREGLEQVTELIAFEPIHARPMSPAPSEETPL
ncbi:hypothetical protein ACFYOF_16975 [Streptomyces sp. NPDC007148]|uniref:hypothetical protein n=1 Tax=Streptomyces sp. NPDC007148 TaxID=3364775 RepID=UPI0036975F5C